MYVCMYVCMYINSIAGKEMGICRTCREGDQDFWEWECCMLAFLCQEGKTTFGGGGGLPPCPLPSFTPPPEKPGDCLNFL